jgi:hypothetical protein
VRTMLATRKGQAANRPRDIRITMRHIQKSRRGFKAPCG